MEGGWRWGPVRLHPILRLKDFGFDSNVYRTGAGTEQSDLTGRIVGGVQGQVPLGRRTVLSFEALPDYLFFARTKNLNAFGSTARARADLFLRSLSAFAAAGWVESTERLGNEIDDRERVTSRTYSGGLGLRMDKRLGFTTVMDTLSIRYPDHTPLASGAEQDCGSKAGAETTGDLLDRDESDLRLGARYRLRGDGSAFAEFTRGRSDFTVCNERDARRSSFQLGFVSDPRAPLSLELRAGPGRLDARSPTQTDFHGLLGEAAVTWKPTGQWKFTGGAGRAIPFSIVGSNLYAEENHLAAGVLRSLGGRFALEAGGERVRLLWPEPGPDPPDLARQDRIHSLFIGGRARIVDRGELTLRLGWRRRNSNIPGEQDSQVTILTGAAF